MNAKTKLKRTPHFTSTGLEVRQAGVKGLGVFALKPFKKGEIIEIAPVIYVGEKESELLDLTKLASYGFSTYGGAFQHEEGYGIALGYGSLYNHSKRGNSDWRITTVAIVVAATKNIKAGDEITFDYGWDAKTLKANGIPVKA